MQKCIAPSVLVPGLEDDLSPQLHVAVCARVCAREARVVGRSEEISCSQERSRCTEVLPVEGVEDIQLQLHGQTFGELSRLENARIQIVEGLAAQCVSSHSRVWIAERIGRLNIIHGVRRRRVWGTSVRLYRPAAGYSQNELIEIVVAVGSAHCGLWIGWVWLKSLKRSEWLTAVVSIHGVDRIAVCHLGEKVIAVNQLRDLVDKSKGHYVGVGDAAYAPLGGIGIERILRKLKRVSSGAGWINLAGIVDRPAVGVLERAGKAVEVACGHVRLQAVVIGECCVAHCCLKRSLLAVQRQISGLSRVLAERTRRNIIGKRRGQRFESWISVQSLKEGCGVVAYIAHFDDHRVADSILNAKGIGLRERIAEVGQKRPFDIKAWIAADRERRKVLRAHRRARCAGSRKALISSAAVDRTGICYRGCNGRVLEDVVKSRVEIDGISPPNHKPPVIWVPGKTNTRLVVLPAVGNFLESGYGEWKGRIP